MAAPTQPHPMVIGAGLQRGKLDEFIFFGNRLQVTYAPHFESPFDTKEKLEGRRKEVLGRLNTGKFRGQKPQISNSDSKDAFPEPLIQSSSEHVDGGTALAVKKARVDNRRRI
ncbi:hypothetical protein ACLOJK_023874 [Asimina triloba]